MANQTLAKTKRYPAVPSLALLIELHAEFSLLPSSTSFFKRCIYKYFYCCVSGNNIQSTLAQQFKCYQHSWLRAARCSCFQFCSSYCCSFKVHVASAKLSLRSRHLGGLFCTIIFMWFVITNSPPELSVILLSLLLNCGYSHLPSPWNM